MRLLLFIFFSICLFQTKSQTLIGKSKAEIFDLNNKSGNKMTFESGDSFINEVFFADTGNQMNYMFGFNEKLHCVAYTIFTNNKAKKDSILGVV